MSVCAEKREKKMFVYNTAPKYEYTNQKENISTVNLLVDEFY